MKVRVATDADGGRTSYWLWCPACEDSHRITDAWGWDGDTNWPTFTPSILVRGVQWAEGEEFHKTRHDVPAGGPTVCHSFLTGGVWSFLADCTHDLAGHQAPVVDLPDWLAR